MADIQVRDDSKQAVIPLPKKAVLVRAGVAVATVAAIGLAMPLIVSAVVGGAGLMVLGVFAIVGIAVVQALPLIGQKWENKLLQLRKAEARQNPEEELDKRVMYKKEQLRKAQEALCVIAGYVRGLSRMIAKEEKEDPDHDVSHLHKTLESMQVFVFSRVEKMKLATEKLAEFDKAVKRWKFEHRFAQQGKIALDSIKNMEGADTMGELLTAEAIQSIEEKFDAVFGEMDIESMLSQASQLKMRNPQLIDMDEALVIDEPVTAKFETLRRG
jgi:hypothetical protein